MSIQVAIEVRLVEAYRSSDNDTPSACFKGVGSGAGWRGALECVIRGDGLQLDGLRIGDRYRLAVEPATPTVTIDAGHDQPVFGPDGESLRTWPTVEKR